MTHGLSKEHAGLGTQVSVLSSEMLTMKAACPLDFSVRSSSQLACTVS